MRSKGSWRWGGSEPALYAWARLSSSGSKAVRSVVSRIEPSPLSLPAGVMIATSHIEAELTSTVFEGSSTTAEAAALIDSPSNHQRRAWVSRRRFTAPGNRLHQSPMRGGGHRPGSQLLEHDEAVVLGQVVRGLLDEVLGPSPFAGMDSGDCSFVPLLAS